MITTRPPRVRPWLRHLSVAFCVLMVPFVVLAAWDYHEVRQLQRTIDDLRARNEPVTFSDLSARRARTAENAEAARYREAAGVIAYGTTPAIRDLLVQVRRARPDEDLPGELKAQLRRALHERRAPLQLLDHAAQLPIEPVTGDFRTNAIAQGIRLAELAALRTRLAVEDADVSGAVHSLATELHLISVLLADRHGFLLGSPAYQTIGDIGQFVTRMRPAEEQLATISNALAATDRDTMKEQYQTTRVRAMQGVRNRVIQGDQIRPSGLFDWGRRASYLRTVNRQVRVLTELVSAAEKPWPERLQNAWSVPPTGNDWTTAAALYRTFEVHAQHTATVLGLIRAARIVVAAARYKSSEGTVPTHVEQLVPQFLPAPLLDPFTGEPLKWSNEEVELVVYSVGQNRRDDRGDVAARPRGPYADQRQRFATSAHDVGVRIAWE